MILTAQSEDKPLQTFSYEKLWLEPTLSSRPLGWLKLYNQGFIVDPFQDPSNSYLKVRDAKNILVIMP